MDAFLTITHDPRFGQVYSDSDGILRFYAVNWSQHLQGFRPHDPVPTNSVMTYKFDDTGVKFDADTDDEFDGDTDDEFDGDTDDEFDDNDEDYFRNDGFDRFYPQPHFHTPRSQQCHLVSATRRRVHHHRGGQDPVAYDRDVKTADNDSFGTGLLDDDSDVEFCIDCGLELDPVNYDSDDDGFGGWTLSVCHNHCCSSRRVVQYAAQMSGYWLDSDSDSDDDYWCPVDFRCPCRVEHAKDLAQYSDDSDSDSDNGYCAGRFDDSDSDDDWY